jgi:hypothetical protein
MTMGYPANPTTKHAKINASVIKDLNWLHWAPAPNLTSNAANDNSNSD